MGNFSKSPEEVLQASLSRSYVGMHIEQGVPVLDRDLNLLHDIVAATLRSVITNYIGDGIAVGSNGFAIQAIPADNDFRVLAGSALVGGVEVTNTAGINYNDQMGVPLLTTPPAPRVDTVYLDVSQIEVDGTKDGDLLNSGDLGLQTSVRQKAVFVVRVAEGAPIPGPDPGHRHFPLAQLKRTGGVAEIGANIITDLRQTRLTLTDIERRIRVLEGITLLPAFALLQPFIPEFGPVNQQVALNGRNFNLGTPRVLFGTVEAPIVGTPTATQIVTKVPAGVTGSVPITVITDGGTAVSEKAFRVEAGTGTEPAFEGQQFSPEEGRAGAQITLSGRNFNAPNLRCAFGKFLAEINVFTPGNLVRTTVPFGGLAVPPGGASGPVRITVVNDRGRAVSDKTFNVIPRQGRATKAPAFTASPDQFEPKRGKAGQSVRLQGSNFDPKNLQVRVFFDDDPAVVEVISDGGLFIFTRVPGRDIFSPTRSVRIMVRTDLGETISKDIFVIDRGESDGPAFAPSPGQFKPQKGKIGEEVTLFGGNFERTKGVMDLQVYFGDNLAPSSIIRLSPTQIVTVVPPGVAIGPVKITVLNDLGRAVSTDEFEVLL
jgi:hypothetical protein